MNRLAAGQRKSSFLSVSQSCYRTRTTPSPRCDGNTPLVLSPAMGPSHCAAPAYSLHPSGPATGKASSLRGPRTRPIALDTPTLQDLLQAYCMRASDFVIDSCASYAQRKLGWAGLCTVRNANSTHVRAPSPEPPLAGIRSRSRRSAALSCAKPPNGRRALREGGFMS